MRRYISIKRASALIKGFKSAKVLVIGDLIMDHFIWGKVKRISPEAPVPVVEVTSESLMLGGSANVVNNISSLGGRSFVTGVVGEDADGRNLLRLLREKGIPCSGIVIDRKRPTTIKTRVIAHSQQVVRFDREKKDGIEQDTAKKVLNCITRAARAADVVIISDYAKGLISSPLVEETVRECRRFGKPLLIDPKVEHFDYYKGAAMVTPNNIEAALASGVDIDGPDSLKKAGETLLKRLGCEALLITRGERGMSLFEAFDADSRQTDIPTVAQEVFDVSGAGDTVIAVLALAMASDASYKEAAVLANFAAGVVVGKIGTAALTEDELMSAVTAGLKKP
ncbi:MAG: D-glycero-beta-D-manno-heptose-7-phosphate kinase [Deltaproteobacteria bacterium]|nr:D-glycero-beta-D-manno-heptose-7-phosphate kinase [Deltaproteobacteria bacterium]